MAEKRKPKLTKVTDKKQSENFKKVARELEADGDLNLTEAEEKLDRILKANKSREKSSHQDS